MHSDDALVPGVQLARHYQRRWLRPDLITGATVLAMLVPQGMAYGELAGVAPIAGLYTSLAALIGYALFGRARQLMIGPGASSALLVATAIAPLAVGIIAAALLVIFLLWLTPLLANLPQVALAAIIIGAAINLIDFKPLLKVYKVRRLEFALGIVTIIGVLGVGVLRGILVAVLLALLNMIGRISHPHNAVLGSVDGIDGYHDIKRHSNSETVTGLIAYRFDAPLFFATERIGYERLYPSVRTAVQAFKERQGTSIGEMP